MNHQPTTHQNRAIILAITLLLVAAFFRVARLDLLPTLPNFAPVMAIAFCGALLLPGWMAIVVPGAALIASDLLLNAHYGTGLIGGAELIRYACYGVAIAAGLALRNRPARLPVTFGVVTANALLFYVVTNTAAWFTNPAYTKSFAGLVQSLTVGVPGFPPTWVFFRNSLLSDWFFTALILTAVALATRPALITHTGTPKEQLS